ncbi:hypothetical protein HNR26_000022 [Rhizobium rosettiformans]|uniref:Uncharacterized protein n=2 Tax=Rhizobium rosettiformans TaxID=1368430 RepID=A0A4V4HRL7_9HYPH|nr:hypothetical protein [Rhizobium rosettiformans]MBB5273984.1 hypothetical protein [Rhizobium rosettiformans]THV38346.1 hypothetical protein FAA86_06040 [Rhizobium rosettiformans W3]
MDKIEQLLAEVRHIKFFLESAETGLDSEGLPSSRVGAASIGIESAFEGFPVLMKMLDECKKEIQGEKRKAPTLADVERISMERGERDRARSAAGKTVN